MRKKFGKNKRKSELNLFVCRHMIEYWSNPFNQLSEVIKFAYKMITLDAVALSKDPLFVSEWRWFNNYLNHEVESFYA